MDDDNSALSGTNPDPKDKNLFWCKYTSAGNCAYFDNVRPILTMPITPHIDAGALALRTALSPLAEAPAPRV